MNDAQFKDIVFSFKLALGVCLLAVIATTAFWAAMFLFVFPRIVSGAVNEAVPTALNDAFSHYQDNN